MTAVLVIAGSDSSGGAGLTRDVATLERLGIGVLCAITAVTAQSEAQVVAVHPVPPEIVRAQITAALATGRVAAVKVGMLGTAAAVMAVADALAPRTAAPLVLDPVLAATAGGELLEPAGREALRQVLLAQVTLLTPNIAEAAALLGERVARDEQELLRQGGALLALGPEAVLLKGGHGSGALATDLLLRRGEAPLRLTAPRSNAVRRGTGCTLSSAIAAGLARGLDLTRSCEQAKQYVTNYIQHGA
ncbi:MAG TPA: bifunctional hydroxymethylpyrimidine kinase/phosphomethylpyrimidine kinase [Steroidobacteraceae bacterium]|nr:bifunctional hydroxymethylpyrimidine kinase/phosphomethylpyrimidine kinase [Steroidobacteraceae bacterium]